MCAALASFLFRYEEFFGTKKKKSYQRKSKPTEDSEDNDEEFENQVINGVFMSFTFNNLGVPGSAFIIS